MGGMALKLCFSPLPVDGIKDVFVCQISVQASSHNVTGNVGRPALLIPDFKALFGTVVVYVPELRVDVSLVLLWTGN
jgi:hypothetical protein